MVDLGETYHVLFGVVVRGRMSGKARVVCLRCKKEKKRGGVRDIGTAIAVITNHTCQSKRKSNPQKQRQSFRGLDPVPRINGP